MTNLEKFYPGVKLEAFRLGSSALAHKPDSDDCCIDCMECPAFDYCQDVYCQDVKYKTCIDIFEEWGKKEYEG